MFYPISKSNISKRYGPLLVLLVLIIAICSVVKADGFLDVGAPVYLNVPSYAKQAAIFNTRAGVDGIAVLHWELDHGDPISLPDGTADTYGHKALVSVFRPDPGTIPSSSKKIVGFHAPYFLRYGDKTDGPYENDLVSGDMNGDTFLDLVLLNAASGTVAIFYNDGDGNFPSAPSVEVKVTSIPLPEGLQKHPFQLAVGDFNSDGEKDIAVSYTDRSWLGENWNFIVVELFASKTSPTSYRYTADDRRGIWDVKKFSTGGLFPSGWPVLDYCHGSPFYTIGEAGLYQEKGNIFQMMAATEQGKSYDSLIFRINGGAIYSWDYVTGTDKHLTATVGGLDYFDGPFTVARLDSGAGANALDLILGAGTGIMFNEGVTPWATIPVGNLPARGGVVAEDFNVDGFMDIARVSGDDPDKGIAGTKLSIAYGDGTLTNPIFMGGKKVIPDLPVPPRWWENPLVMRTGNFTGERDVMTGKPFPSIMVLGADILVIYPNIGNNLPQMDKPRLEQILSGSEASEGDKVRVSGWYLLGTPGEINSLILTAVADGKVTVIPRAQLTTTVGTPETLEFVVPSGLALGDYTIKVKNTDWSSNELRFKLTARPRLDALVNGPTASPGEIVRISGNFLLGTPSEITELVLTARISGKVTVIPRASLTIYAGMPEYLDFTLPMTMDTGDHYVEVRNARSSSNRLSLLIL